MSDPSDSLSLAEHGADRPGLPPPPPLCLAGRTALFLDFDGTLVEIADRPDEVIVPDTVPRLIETLARRLEGRLALVSGRSLAVLETLLGPMEVAMAGSHGGEFRPAGVATAHSLAAPLPDDVVKHLSGFAEANGGLLVEPKPFSVAVHYRRHPNVLERLLTCAEAIASRRGLEVKHGKQVVELVMPGSDKGTAIACFMKRAEFAGTTPLFVGDDVTDEDAFHAVARFGGTGVLVGAMRPTAAHWRLDDVAAVHAWLAAALQGKECA